MHLIETDTRLETDLDSDKKYIVIIGPAHPLRGGLATYNQILASKLQEQGHRVEILSFSLQYPSLLFPGKTQYSIDRAPESLTIKVALNSINPFNWIKLGLQLRKAKPDLIIFRYWIPFMAPCLGSIARIVKANKHSRLVAIADNINPHESMPLQRPITRYFLKSCHGFVCMSRAVLQELKDHKLNMPAFFNPHPMYESFGAAVSKEEACDYLKLDKHTNYLLFFGFIRQYKGLDLLLRAFANEKLAKMNVKLIIAGEYYEDAEPYKKLIQELKLEGRLVQHNHFIPDSEVKYYFSLADMVVQTYKHATQSGVTQVAYHYDRPMLVTNVGGLAELVPDGVVGYVREAEVSEIASALIDFYEHNKFNMFSEGAKKEKLKFRWEEMIQSIYKAAQL